jgi:hypothetical protein
MAEYYHVSPTYNKKSILKQGLDPQAKANDWDWDAPEEESRKPMRRVHFATGIGDARKWAAQVEGTHGDQTSMSIYKVDTKGLPLIQKTSDIGLVDTYTPKNVSPTRLTHLEDFHPTLKDYDYN